MSLHPLLQGLNPEQARAVETIDGPLLILAGAGSGKTRVLTRRVAWLIENGVPPWRILAVTFTNKAAAEMKERVRHLVGERGDEVWMSTFHSTCVRILRRDAEVLGYPRGFAIWDDDDQLRALKRVMADLKIDPKIHPPRGFRGAIDKAKNALQGPDDLPTRPGDRVPAVFRAYEEALKAGNALDFNDLINKVVVLWRDHPEVLARWQDRFRYVMVDEYQDTNRAQYELLRLLMQGRSPQNLAVVGDDDQSIYSFRGADIRNILDFEKDFPAATVVKLEQNYRSSANILSAASSVVKNNEQRKDKTLRTDAEPGALLRWVPTDDEDTEADAVIREMRALLRSRRASDLAIIYRTNAQSRPFERALTDARIPYVLVGGRKFYERTEVRDMLAYLKLLLNPADDMAFQRIVNVPARGLGAKAVDTVREEATRNGEPMLAAARRVALLGGRAGGAWRGFVALVDGLREAMLKMEPGALVGHVAEATGYLGELRAEDTMEARGRIENIEALASAVDADAAAGGEPVDRLLAFLDRASLSGQADELPDAESGAVTLLTAHLAKGLEFPVVFVVGMAEGTFPLVRAEREEDREEERRLAYVAITRARELLYFTAPRKRWANSDRGGRYQRDVGPSPFLAEIPPQLFERPPSSRPAAGASWPSRPGAGSGWSGSAPSRGGWSSGGPSTSMGRGSSGYSSPPAGAGSTLRRPGFGPPPTPRPSPRAAVPPDRVRMRPDSPDAFRTGVEVFHPMWGAGTITACEGSHRSLKLTIDFPDHGSKTVFAASAGMDILLP